MKLGSSFIHLLGPPLSKSRQNPSASHGTSTVRCSSWNRTIEHCNGCFIGLTLFYSRLMPFPVLISVLCNMAVLKTSEHRDAWPMEYTDIPFKDTSIAYTTVITHSHDQSMPRYNIASVPVRMLTGTESGRISRRRHTVTSVSARHHHHHHHYHCHLQQTTTTPPTGST